MEQKTKAVAGPATRSRNSARPALAFFRSQHSLIYDPSAMKSKLSFSLFALAGLWAAALFPPSVHAQETPTPAYADLSGKVDGFKLRKLASGMIKIQGKITISNLSATAARNVRVNVYLSDDQTFDPEDRVYTVNLADNDGGKGKLKGNSQTVIPLKEKLAGFVATLIAGQYLIFQFDAKNETPTPADSHNVVVVGPIAAP